MDIKNITRHPKSSVAALVIVSTLCLMIFKVISTQELLAIWGSFAALIGFFKNDNDLNTKTS